MLKLQNNFIWLLSFNNYGKMFSERFNECTEKHCRTHLLSSECNYHVSAKAPALAYSFHELGAEASLVGIAAILPELPLLIQIYFDIVDFVDYVDSLNGQ
jgi:hypothetical protein